MHMHNLQKSIFWKHLIFIFPYFEIYTYMLENNSYKIFRSVIQ
jgi:hypothetical protein